MKWLIAILAAGALLLSGFAVYRVKRVESATTPQLRTIAAVR